MPNLEPNYKDSYSPRLTNNDLAPTRDQNWTWYNIFSFWMSDVHSMGGYVVAASFFALGLALSVLEHRIKTRITAQTDAEIVHQEDAENEGKSE